VIALMRQAIARSSASRFESRRWPELHLVDVSFAIGGDVSIPPLAFYLVGTVTGGLRICEGHDGGPPARHVALESSTLVRGMARSFNYAWAAPHCATLICLDPTVVKEAASESGIGNPDRLDLVSSYEADAVCRHLVTVLAEEAKVPPHAAQPMIVESVASALAVHMLAKFSASEPLWTGGPGAGALTYRVFERVRVFIEDNVGERMSLQDLARVAGISRFHFARQFRLRTGESPMGYLLRRRIERAKPMLRGPSAKRISEIAADLGFADQSHFARTFRRLVGMSPSDFGGSRKATSALVHVHDERPCVVDERR
jgi:AraC family transcriptional regulator